MAVRCKGGIEKIAKLEENLENLEDDIDSYNQTICLGRRISSRIEFNCEISYLKSTLNIKFPPKKKIQFYIFIYLNPLLTSF